MWCSSRFLVTPLLASFFLLAPAGATSIFLGSDGTGPLQFLNDPNATFDSNFGPSTGSVGASNGNGGLFVATPGDTSSTVDDVGPGQNVLGSFNFTAQGDARPFASYISDMTWGMSNTLWVSTFTGVIYHLTATGSVLDSFDTGTNSPGIATDGVSLYTTSGPGFLAASPFIYKRDTTGTVLDTINTGLNDTLGLGYDSSSNTFWVGGFDVLTHVDATGSILDTFDVPGTHYGVELGALGPITPPSTVPEPASVGLTLLGGLLFVRRLRWNKRLLSALVAVVAAPVLMRATPVVTSVTPNPAGPQPVGTKITFTVNASDTDGSDLRYRFQIRSMSGGSFDTIQDYSKTNSLTWVPADTEGTYEVQVTVLNHSTQATSAGSVLYTLTSRVAAGVPVVNPSTHPLVALYSAPACPAGSTMRVRFKRPRDAYWQSTSLKPCNGTSSMNFYVGGMLASSQYLLKHDIINGPRVTSGPQLTFTSGTIPIALPAVQNVQALQPPTSMTQGVTLFATFATHPFAVDAAGRVIWYDPNVPTFMTRLAPGGYFLETFSTDTNIGQSVMREIDLAGNVVKTTTVEDISDQLAAMGGPQLIGVFHHEVRRMPNGNFVTLAHHEVLSSAQGAPNDIAGDIIIVTDSNFKVLWFWNAFDHLDVNRKATLNELCGTGGGGCSLQLSTAAHDWTHGNSVSLAPDGNLVYSARNQDFAYKIAYQNGSGDGHIIWQLGRGGNFVYNSTDPFPWFTHQHDVEYEDATTISVFDDGNTRVAENNNSGNSRGQALKIDENAHTISFILNADLGAYSSALGSAERLDNGNYAFDNGIIDLNHTQSPEWSPASGVAGSQVSLLQVNGVLTYRTFRLRDLYSGTF